MRKPSIIHINIIQAGVDPDCLARLKVLGEADYESLGFPRQGLANDLRQQGILARKGRPKGRTIWAPGPKFDSWLMAYLRDRFEFRKAKGLPVSPWNVLDLLSILYHLNPKQQKALGFTCC
jgi:hypothetical protein